MNASTLLDLVREAAGAGVWRGSGNLAEEALENIEYFPAPPHGGTGGVDPLELATALTEAVRAWLGDAASDGTGRPGTVYVWHDDQAAQLRMSFVSGGRDDIPFGVPLVFLDRPHDIVDDFLAGAYRRPDDPVKIFARELEAEARTAPGR
ncbi:hypothetical protein OG401_01880 [Kitasatospora purpeofusca]|uniref:hypothetical protein n=1 Tax=Kitasatospora purpeofusca TaxID=67352 RepID=UPI00224EA8CC|nr:hypothetical protein [Kitasatospora purpeofusca]MCX4683068.1 hypothetical protein [Kitasatospora purpeofusca]